MDKRCRAEQFRDRLERAMRDANTNQSALARRIGVDRSTLSQLLGSDGARLPNAQIVAELATALHVSADWLLGLSNRPEQATEMLANALRITDAPRALVDEQIFEWHREAAGYKIRHVPATLPDMFKTRALLEWEYEPHLGKSTEQAVNASAERLAWMRGAHSDYEIAIARHELECFASGAGYYGGLDPDIRRAQIDHLRGLFTDFYPRVRIYVYDARKLFSAPITIFGPLLAVLYVGRHYLAFRDSDRIDTLTEHFDTLVKQAEIPARDLPQFLDHLSDLTGP